MTKFKKSLMALALCFAIPASAYAVVTKGELQRMQDLILDIATATVTTITATTATITTLTNTTLTNSGVLTENRAPSADSATTNNSIDLNLTAPVDTTGTNTHQGYNVDLTIGNATGGTNTVNAFNLGNVTGDAQVNINGIKIGTGTTLGTSYALSIGSGWDAGISNASKVINTYVAGADSGATNIAESFALTFPIDTTGTNTHTLIDMALTAANATGGTNTVNGFNFANYTGDAQVNVNAINIGTSDALGTANAITVGAGWDLGLSIASIASFTADLYGDGGDQFYGFLQDQVASTTVAITAAQAAKTFVSNSADVMTLPEASTVLGARYTFVCGTADDFDINPADGTDAISVVASITGTNTTTVLAPSAGDAIRCTDIGSSIVLEAVAADLWASIGTANGIWTDVN